LKEVIGEVYPRRVDQLGDLVARLHRTLATPGPEDPSFQPEPFSLHYQRSLYQGMRSTTGRVLNLLENEHSHLSAALQKSAAELCQERNALYAVYGRLLHEEVTGQKIRIHGDLHLAQLLNTGDHFLFIDFEGEPSAALSERRLKRPALRDVASMLRSFDYAVATALLNEAPEDRCYLSPWARGWVDSICSQFLQVYLEACEGAEFLPPEGVGRTVLLQALMLDKAVYELGYELQYRPEWAAIPMQAIGCLLKEGAAGLQ
jgi:maltose alpha-D-glucosyltransferase/alpha-amylase